MKIWRFKVKEKTAWQVLGGWLSGAIGLATVIFIVQNDAFNAVSFALVSVAFLIVALVENEGDEKDDA